MDLYLIRHAVAEDREEFALTGRDDRLRPLAEKGIKRMEKVARAFCRIHPDVSLIATSPLVRAQQTTELIRPFYPNVPVIEAPELVPEASPETFLSWLVSQQRRSSSVAAIGHEPMLSNTACWLMTGTQMDFCYFKKAGIMRLFFADKIAAGRAELKGYYPPKMLSVFQI